ncbi:MAG: flavodoxin-like domain-containing protein [Candidatus Cloacimonetes bacterium]|nr:flavodoxin-like domain-containing protein [Candidatus Cloacimonadota bacterium]
MEIALIYHSQTGNTERFANALADALMLAGHTVNSIKLQTVNPVKQAHVKSHQDIAFTNLPDPAAFDLILFGGPVWAFGPSPVIIAAISEMGTLSGKKAIPFATMGFPFKWMGGSAALRYMQRELATKGAKVLPGYICCQMFKNLDSEIEQATKALIQAIK